MRRVMVRYKVKPDQVEANEELVRAVYEELDRTSPAGLRYATFKLADGVSDEAIRTPSIRSGLLRRAWHSLHSYEPSASNEFSLRAILKDIP